MLGYSKNLDKNDMWDIDDTECCEYLTARMEAEWNARADQYMEDVKELKARGSEVNIKEPSLLLCLIKIFYGKFLAGTFMKLVQDSTLFRALTLISVFASDLISIFLSGLAFVGPIILR